MMGRNEIRQVDPEIPAVCRSIIDLLCRNDVFAALRELASSPLADGIPGEYIRGLTAVVSGDLPVARVIFEKLVRRNRSNPHFKYYLAYVCLKQGDAKAIPLLREIREKDPQRFPDLESLLIASHLLQGEWGDACACSIDLLGRTGLTLSRNERDWIVRALVRGTLEFAEKRDTPAVMQLTELLDRMNPGAGIRRFVSEMREYCGTIEAANLLKAGKSREALELLERLYEKNKRNHDVLKFLSICHEQLEDYNRANIFWKKFSKLHQKSGGKNGDSGSGMLAYTHRMIGYNYLRIGKRSKAVSEFRKSLRFNPADSNLRKRLIMLYLSLKRQEDASRELDYLMDTEPGDPETHLAAGMVLTGSQDWERAYREWKKAWELGADLRPYEDEVWISAASLLRMWAEEERYREIMDEIDPILEWMDHDEEFLMYRAVGLLGTGETREGKRLIDRLSRRILAEEVLYVDLAYYCDRFGLKRQMKRFMKRGMAEYGNRHTFYMDLIVLYHLRNKDQRADEIFRDATESFQNREEREFLLCTLYVALSERNLAAAKRYADLLKRIDPESPRGLLTLGMVFAAERKRKKAIECFEIAREMGYDVDSFLEDLSY
jgi:tetratricopeptide (TPR) repeat protein